MKTQIESTNALATHVHALERRLRRTQAVACGAALSALALGALGMAADEKPEVLDEVRAHRFVMVDDQGVPRVVIAQDPANTDRRSRAAGITIRGKDGAERAGFSTLDDDTVVLALDAPVGVGAPMRDRLGLTVNARGGAQILLIDNKTRGVVGLYSDGDGEGGLQTLDWHVEDGFLQVKTTDFHGEQIERVELGGD